MAEFDFDISSREIGSKTKWSLESDIGGKVSLRTFIDFANSTLVSITKDVLKEETRKGFPEDYIEVTDGVVGKPFQLVDITKRGTIDISAQASVEDIIKFIFNSVEERSRIVTGRYVDSHVMLYNKSEVASNTEEAIAWSKTAKIKKGDTIQFLNFQPYARKLERLGVTAQKSKPRLGKVRDRDKDKKSGRVGFKPNGVYYLTALLARKVYSKGIGKIRFEWVQGEAGISGASDIPRSTFARDGRPYLYPSIIIVFDVRGVK